MCMCSFQVFYDEEIVEPLLNTIRRQCLLSRTENDRCPDVYLCASHRTERIENLFFSAAARFFAFEDVSEQSSMRQELRREFVSIWRVSVRAGVAVKDLAEGLVLGHGYESVRMELGIELTESAHGNLCEQQPGNHGKAIVDAIVDDGKTLNSLEVHTKCGAVVDGDAAGLGAEAAQQVEANVGWIQDFCGSRGGAAKSASVRDGVIFGAKGAFVEDSMCVHSKDVSDTELEGLSPALENSRIVDLEELD